MAKRYFNISLLSVAFVLSALTSHTPAFGDLKTKILSTIIIAQQIHIYHPEITTPYIEIFKKKANEIYNANIKKEHVDIHKKHINPNLYEEPMNTLEKDRNYAAPNITNPEDDKKE